MTCLWEEKKFRQVWKPCQQLVFFLKKEFDFQPIQYQRLCQALQNMCFKRKGPPYLAGSERLNSVPLKYSQFLSVEAKASLLFYLSASAPVPKPKHTRRPASSIQAKVNIPDGWDSSCLAAFCKRKEECGSFKTKVLNQNLWVLCEGLNTPSSPISAGTNWWVLLFSLKEGQACEE